MFCSFSYSRKGEDVSASGLSLSSYVIYCIDQLFISLYQMLPRVLLHVVLPPSPVHLLFHHLTRLEQSFTFIVITLDVVDGGGAISEDLVNLVPREGTGVGVLD